MKKILALILCFVLLAVPVSASAEGEPTPEQGEVGTDWNEIKDTVSGAIVEWVEPNIEEIGVIVTLLGYGIMLFKKLKAVLKNMGTMNNNTITISKENAALMAQAMASINDASGAVTAYDARILALLEAYQKTAESEKRLEAELVEIKSYLKTSSMANLEFADELAELLGLANIPNYVKEQIGARHVAAKKNIIEAEKKAEALLTAPEEVKNEVGENKAN